LLSLKKYKKAEKNYSKAIYIDPEIMGAYLNRSIVRENLDDIDGAIKDCNKAIQLNNFSAHAFGNRGYLKFKKEEYDEAIKDYNRALKIEPENTRVLMARAFTNYQLKDLQGTMDDYNKVLEIDPNNAHCYYNRALLKSEIGDYNSAIEDFNNVLEMNPDNMLIYFNRGFVKMDIGDLYGAMDDFSTAIRIYPDFAKAYLARASVKRDLNDEKGAMKDRYQALQIIDRYKAMKNEGKMSAFVDTTENFQRLIDLNSRESFTEEVIKGRVQDKRVSIELENNFHITHLSMDSLRAGKIQYYDQTIMKYNQKQNYHPAFTISNHNRRYPKALVDKQVSLAQKQIESEEASAYFHRGSYQLMDRKYNKAIADFNKALEKDPNFLFAYFNRANALVAMTDYIQSIGGGAESVVSLRPDENKNKNEVIVDYSSAIKDYTKVIQLDPSFSFAIFNRANAYAKSKQFKRAIADYDWALQLDSNFKEAYYNRGLIYLFLDDKALAYEDLSKAGELGLIDAYNVIKRYCNKPD
jgi:tetratricopeptide (TPR) repeat protein